MKLSQPQPHAGPRTVVIGAGVVGLCCAVEIARDGGDVTIIDADAALASRAASHAAAGMLAPFSEALHEAPGHNRRLADLCAAGLVAWRALAEGDPAMDRLVRFPGAWLIARDDADAVRVRQACARAHAHGAPAIFSEGLAPDLDANVFGAGVMASARLPGEGIVAPAMMLAALAGRAATLGVSLQRGRRVTEIVQAAGAVSGVRFEDGDVLAADAVVIATGAAASPSLRSIAPALGRVTPAKGMLATTSAPEHVSMPEIVRSPRLYLICDGANLRFGATLEMGRSDLDDDPDAIDRLFAELRNTIPGARFSGPARQASVGVRPMSPDGAPLVGADGPRGCLVAIGHGRNGWLLGPLTGVAIAAMVRGDAPTPIWAGFKPNRFN